MRRSTLGVAAVLLAAAAACGDPTGPERTPVAPSLKFSLPPPPPIFGMLVGPFAIDNDPERPLGTALAADMVPPVVMQQLLPTLRVLQPAIYSRGPAQTRIFIEFAPNGSIQYSGTVTSAHGVITKIDGKGNRWRIDLGQLNGLPMSPFVACPGNRTDYCLRLVGPLYGTVELWNGQIFGPPIRTRGTLTFSE
jgi:hypothetical protein